jgi:Domain of unknown function (DUF4340)
MSRERFLWLLAAALLVISVALYLNTRRNASRESPGVSLLLPTLARELDSVTQLSVRKGAATPSVTLHKSAAAWTVAERGDYPADVTKLRKLLVSLGDARIVEGKTSDPANFSIIGVEDPTQPSATGAEVTVAARDGTHAVIVGKSGADGNFARRAGENKSYLIEPAIAVETQPRDWIDTRLIDVPVASIQSIEVKPVTGPGYVIRRIKSNEDAFTLEGIPAGRKAVDSHALAPSNTVLGNLTAEDVAAAADIDFSKPSQAILTLSDGAVISVTGAPVGDKRWIQLKSSKDDALTAKTQGRAFEVAGYRYDAIFRPLEQLLAPKDSPAAAKKPTAPANKPPRP